METIGKPMSWRERIDWVLDNRPELNPSTWALSAGFHRNLVRNTYKRNNCDPKGRTIWALAHIAKVSQNWLGTGLGDPNGPDVPIGMPPKKPARFYRDLPGWTEHECQALSRAREIDWAIIGVAEMEVTDVPAELTAWWIIGQAEAFRLASKDLPQERRQELDAKAVARIAACERHTPIEHPSGKYLAIPASKSERV